MAKIYEIDGVAPVIDPSSFVHPDAVIIGDVIIGANCYIGPCASLRGDFGQIFVADGCNIQEGCVLHSFPNKQCRVDENGHIAHGAVLHGCHVKRHGFVGIRAVVMDGAVIGESAMVAAMAFIKAEFELPDRCMAAGMPAKIVREMDDTQIKWMQNAPLEYQELARRSNASLKPTTPLHEIESVEPRLSVGDRATRPYNETKKG
ncbi:MAG: transferase hexapeptide repeat family protein [Pseudomonadales bacterium]